MNMLFFIPFDQRTIFDLVVNKKKLHLDKDE